MDSEGEQVEQPVGDVIRLLDISVRGKMGSIEERLRALTAEAETLGEDIRGLNGGSLRRAAESWGRDMGALADKIRDESPNVSRALLGTEQPEIVVTVNPELAAAVATDPNRRKT